ncbi:uncharacterized protein LOC108914119 [Anoplophora glabripennis]|uniref:uncharacterized protein LOC108914119 n=1 Tax=Anoplophora glabripennis TaxID=217634 RepID=UPI000874E6CE|nr:uncharacterized protein LOC108914119 [Anoplophora glabripennis]
MKLPFHTILGPIFRKNQKNIKILCGYPALQFAPIYVAILGVLGVILSIFDIVRIIRCGPVLPGYLWRERLKAGKLVTPEAERDCKLVCLVLSSEYYLFLLVGLSTNNPIFFLPFLMLYAVIIFLELLIFFIRAFVEGIDFKKCGLIMSLFMVYNWLSVFCTFARAMTACDI